MCTKTGEIADAAAVNGNQTPGMSWRWLLLLPLVLPLLVTVYNRTEPRLWGVPFFYWAQMACALVAMAVMTIVFHLEKPRRSR